MDGWRKIGGRSWGGGRKKAKVEGSGEPLERSGSKNCGGGDSDAPSSTTARYTTQHHTAPRYTRTSPDVNWSRDKSIPLASQPLFASASTNIESHRSCTELLLHWIHSIPIEPTHPFNAWTDCGAEWPPLQSLCVSSSQTQPRASIDAIGASHRCIHRWMNTKRGRRRKNLDPGPDQDPTFAGLPNCSKAFFTR